jgi:hypothetical protein
VKASMSKGSSVCVNYTSRINKIVSSMIGDDWVVRRKRYLLTSTRASSLLLAALTLLKEHCVWNVSIWRSSGRACLQQW